MPMMIRWWHKVKIEKMPKRYVLTIMPFPAWRMRGSWWDWKNARHARKIDGKWEFVK